MTPVTGADEDLRELVRVAIGREEPALVETVLWALREIPARRRRRLSGPARRRPLVLNRGQVAALARVGQAARALQQAITAADAALPAWVISDEGTRRGIDRLAGYRGKPGARGTLSEETLAVAHYTARALALVDVREGKTGRGARLATTSRNGVLARLLEVIIGALGNSAPKEDLVGWLRVLVGEARPWARGAAGLPVAEPIIVRNPSPNPAVLLVRRDRDR